MFPGREERRTDEGVEVHGGTEDTTLSIAQFTYMNSNYAHLHSIDKGRRTNETGATGRQQAPACRERITMSVQYRRLSPACGTEVCGLDLTQPVGENLFRELHDAWLEA